MYLFKICSEYGKIVYINVVLYLITSFSTYFKSTNEHSIIKFQGGLYFNTNTPYYSKVCQGNGTYEFKIYNEGSYSIYKVYLNNKKKYTFRTSGFFISDRYIEEIFQVRKSLSRPSLSSIPSTIPSIIVYLLLSV